MIAGIIFTVLFIWFFVGAVWVGVITDEDEFSYYNWKQHLVVFICGGPISWFGVYPYKLMKLVIEKLGDDRDDYI